VINEYAALSPDGRWIAYHYNVSGAFEAYAVRYLDLDGRQPVSVNEGTNSVLSRDGSELFLKSPDMRGPVLFLQVSWLLDRPGQVASTFPQKALRS